MQIPAAATLDRLVMLTAPGASVAPVIAALADVAGSIETVGPALEQAHASTWLLGELGRVRGSAMSLHDALAELHAKDGMTTFDAAYAADDASWDAWFTESAELVRRAESVLGQTPISSTTSV